MQNLSSSDLVLNPPSSLDDFLSSYNATLFALLDKHAPIITKSGSHFHNPWYTSYFQAFKSLRRRLERTYKRTRDPQVLSALKSATIDTTTFWLLLKRGSTLHWFTPDPLILAFSGKLLINSSIITTPAHH